ncbi:MAG: Gfo/Idh/MocA family oxidoreductase [Clostridia bacterium]|nr:Gfo/Idh/MocA family oxidoreductase [Clostridia bacterium]
MKKIKTAIIGCGGIAKHHANQYLKLADEFEVVAVCDIIPRRVEAMAKFFGISAAYSDYKDVLEIPGLDAVDICTPNYLHSIIAVDALNKGINVLCEKPDAINVKEAEKMKDAADRNGKLLMVIRNNRFLVQSQYLKKYIDDGNFGKIYAARCGWQRRRGIPGKGGWFTTKAQSGGGPLIDLGVHMIDLTMWLMGNPVPVAVSGNTYCEFANNDVSDSVNSSFGDKKADGTFDVEDLAMGYIRFDNGACMQIEFSWASNIEEENKFFELRGTKAGASFHSTGSDTDNTLKIFTEQYGKTVDLIPNFNSQIQGHLGNLKNFAAALRGDAEPVFKPEQGINMIKILEALYESARTGKEILL